MNKYKVIGLAMLMAVMFLFMMSGIVAMRTPPGQNKMTICHKPGTPAEKTKRIPIPAWEEEGHSTHGDYIGPCVPQVQPTQIPTIVGPPPTPVQATATVVIVPTIAPTEIPATPTNVPQELPPIEVPFVEPTTELPIVVASPTPTTTWMFPTIEPAETCDLCNAQESALHADARLKNTVADFIDMIIDGWIPEVVKFWKE